jgi:hypothetical protein
VGDFPDLLSVKFHLGFQGNLQFQDLTGRCNVPAWLKASVSVDKYWRSRIASPGLFPKY